MGHRLGTLETHETEKEHPPLPPPPRCSIHRPRVGKLAWGGRWGRAEEAQDLVLGACVLSSTAPQCHLSRSSFCLPQQLQLVSQMPEVSSVAPPA